MGYAPFAVFRAHAQAGTLTCIGGGRYLLRRRLVTYGAERGPASARVGCAGVGSGKRGRP